jgi:hypothetical protein
MGWLAPAFRQSRQLNGFVGKLGVERVWRVPYMLGRPDERPAPDKNRRRSSSWRFALGCVVDILDVVGGSIGLVMVHRSCQGRIQRSGGRGRQGPKEKGPRVERGD